MEHLLQPGSELLSPKVAVPQNLSDLRPISVTPILLRLVEKLIARKYLVPALSTKPLENQYALAPQLLQPRIYL